MHLQEHRGALIETDKYGLLKKLDKCTNSPGKICCQSSGFMLLYNIHLRKINKYKLSVFSA